MSKRIQSATADATSGFGQIHFDRVLERLPAGSVPGMLRVGVYVLAGTTSLAYWLVVRPTHEASDQMSQWPYVLFFSGLLATMAIGLLGFTTTISHRWARTAGYIATAALLGSTLVNIIEDGLDVEAMFFAFVAATLTTLVALLVMAGILLLNPRGSQRLLALVPAGLIAGIVLFVEIGWLVMPTTWGIAIALGARTPGGHEA